MNNGKLEAALIGGATFGTLAALPYIQNVNMACCALFVGGGMFSMYLYMKESDPSAKAPYGDGASVGVLSGLVAAVAATVVGLIVNLLGLGADQAEALAMMEQRGIELPDFVLEMMGARGISVASVLTGLVVYGIFATIFATIGGLVGAATFHKRGAV